jgi:Rrf2 family transcriptional regulator, iron-sulfur cluster assembly transcription factor
MRAISVGADMRLSTKGRYAVMAMADLAKHSERDGVLRAVSLAEIAVRQDISLSYLEQLFARLRRHGIVKSVRGPGGGYRLAREAGQTAVGDIVKAVDEPLEAVRCTSGGGGCMPGGERCLTHDLWEELGRQIDHYLSAVSLQDVLNGSLRPGARQAA